MLINCCFTQTESPFGPSIPIAPYIFFRVQINIGTNN